MDIDDRPALTAQQNRVYQFCIDYYHENDQLPPTRAIQEHFGWASQTAAMSHLVRLHAKGWLSKNASAKYKFARPFSSDPPVVPS